MASRLSHVLRNKGALKHVRTSRPILAAAAFAAAASFVSIDAASASCYSGCGYSYAAPVAYYQAPVVYSYSYAPSVSYAAPCSPCGYSYGYSYAPRPGLCGEPGPGLQRARDGRSGAGAVLRLFVWLPPCVSVV